MYSTTLHEIALRSFANESDVLIIESDPTVEQIVRELGILERFTNGAFTKVATILQIFGWAIIITRFSGYDQERDNGWAILGFAVDKHDRDYIETQFRSVLEKSGIVYRIDPPMMSGAIGQN